MNKTLNYIAWALQGICVLILIQSIAVKIMGTDGEVAAFSRLEMEPYGRYIMAFLEVLCLTALVTPLFFRQGAVLAILIFASGVFFHLTELHVVWWADGGRRFYLTLAGLICAVGILLIRNRLAEALYKRGRLD